MSTDIPPICRNIPSDMSLERYSEVFEDELCPEAYIIAGYMSELGLGVQYNEDKVRLMSKGPMKSLITSIRLRTRGFEIPTTLIDKVAFLCNEVPGLCDRALIDNCSLADIPSPLTNDFRIMCGCFLKMTDVDVNQTTYLTTAGTKVNLPDPCSSHCDAGDTVKQQSNTDPSRLWVCDRPICSISPITIHNINSNIGSVNITDICTQCHDGNKCDCYFNTDGLDEEQLQQMNALYRDANSSSVCENVNCFGDCTRLTSGASTAMWWVVIVIVVIFLITGLIIMIF